MAQISHGTAPAAEEVKTAFTRSLSVGIRVSFGLSTPDLRGGTVLRGTVTHVFRQGDPAAVTAAIVDFGGETGSRLWPFMVANHEVHSCQVLGEAEDWIATSVHGSARDNTELMWEFYDPLTYVIHLEGRDPSEREFRFGILCNNLRSYMNQIDSAYQAMNPTRQLTRTRSTGKTKNVYVAGHVVNALLLTLIAWARLTRDMHVTGTDWRTPGHLDVADNVLSILGLHEVLTRAASEQLGKAIMKYHKHLETGKNLRGRIKDAIRRALATSEPGDGDADPDQQ